jgi:TPR repeat protein
MARIEAAVLSAPPPSAMAARLRVLSTLPPADLARLLSGDPEKAAPWVAAAAEAGLAEGQVRLGRMLLEGVGAPRDQAAAHAWFLKAAASGDAEAQNMVGRCHENGWGVAQDYAEAARWFEHAAAQGFAWAQYNLAHLHLDGLGVPRDQARAFALYRAAAEAGHVRAMNLMARCLEEGWGAPADPAAAALWYRRSAEGGYFRGQFNYASLLFAEGRADAARVWFARALDSAPPDARRSMLERLSASTALREMGRPAPEAA